MTSLGPTFQEVVAHRNRREDEPVAKRFAKWVSFGRGHMEKIAYTIDFDTHDKAIG